MVRAFGAVVLVSHDADRMAAFYQQVLGVELEPRLHEGATFQHYACRIGDTTFSIHPVENWREAPETGPGGTRLVFAVTSLDGHAAVLRERRIRFRGPMDLSSGRMLFFRDPDGNLIDLMESSADR